MAFAGIPRSVGKRLKLASPLALRVILWLSLVADGEFDPSACASACGASSEECEEALSFWTQGGALPPLLRAADTESAAAPVRRDPSPRTPAPSLEPAPSKGEEKPAVPSFDPSVPISRTLELRERDERFAYLLEAVGARLGRPLSPTDMGLYRYLYTDVGLPPEVILMGLEYAIRTGKASHRSYLEKMFTGWAQDGITTIEKADEYLCRLEHEAQAIKRVQALCPWMENPTVTQKEHAYLWLYEWRLPEEVIAAAGEFVRQKDVKNKSGYLHRVLERLHRDGVTTAEQAKNALQPPVKAGKKPAGRGAERAPSFDLERWETMVKTRRPHIPQSKEEP